MSRTNIVLAAVLAAGAAIPAFAGSAARAAAPALETVADFRGPMPTGVSVAGNGRIFVNFPRWGDDVPFTVGELRNGVVTAYPDAAINRPDPSRPTETLLSVQSVVADARNRLWILDTGAPEFQTRVVGGAKLVAVDLATNKVVRTIVIPADVALPTTYLNDVRFDLRQGREGVAYITDSSVKGPGGIIVVDLGTGASFRRLSGAASTSPDPSFTPVIGGQPLMNRPAGGPPTRWHVASDGVALSADGRTLFFCPLTSRHLYSVPTAALRDRSVSDAALAGKVADLGLKGASDGLEADDRGRVYGGDYEHDSIVRLENGRWSTLVRDPAILWPDTLSIGPDGYLYFTANQLYRQANFHGGTDLRRQPYKLFRVKIDAGPVELR